MDDDPDPDPGWTFSAQTSPSAVALRKAARNLYAEGTQRGGSERMMACSSP